MLKFVLLVFLWGLGSLGSMAVAWSSWDGEHCVSYAEDAFLFNQLSQQNQVNSDRVFLFTSGI